MKRTGGNACMFSGQPAPFTLLQLPFRLRERKDTGPCGVDIHRHHPQLVPLQRVPQLQSLFVPVNDTWRLVKKLKSTNKAVATAAVTLCAWQ